MSKLWLAVDSKQRRAALDLYDNDRSNCISFSEKLGSATAFRNSCSFCRHLKYSFETSELRVLDRERCANPRLWSLAWIFQGQDPRQHDNWKGNSHETSSGAVASPTWQHGSDPYIAGCSWPWNLRLGSHPECKAKFIAPRLAFEATVESRYKNVRRTGQN